MRETLRGKTALVTGGATRIGRALCIALAEEGANVVVHQRKGDDRGPEMAAALSARGVDAWLVGADFEKPDEYESLIARAAAKAGHLDMLINNAAIFPTNALEDVTLPDIDRAMQVNAWVPFALGRDFARLAGKGKIVNVLDTRIRGYDWTHAAYILSKQALALLTRMSALRFAPEVTVNAVAPGLILPPANKGMDYLEALAGTVPLQRHGSPRDVADAAIYLLTSAFVTGQVIYVDGGMHLTEGTCGPHHHQ